MAEVKSIAGKMKEIFDVERMGGCRQLAVVFIGDREPLRLQADPVMIAHVGPIATFLQQLAGLRQMVRVPHVVRIEQGNPIAGRRMNADVTGRGRISSTTRQEPRSA